MQIKRFDCYNAVLMTVALVGIGLRDNMQWNSAKRLIPSWVRMQEGRLCAGQGADRAIFSGTAFFLWARFIYSTVTASHVQVLRQELTWWLFKNNWLLAFRRLSAWIMRSDWQTARKTAVACERHIAALTKKQWTVSEVTQHTYIFSTHNALVKYFNSSNYRI